MLKTSAFHICTILFAPKARSTGVIHSKTDNSKTGERRRKKNGHTSKKRREERVCTEGLQREKKTHTHTRTALSNGGREGEEGDRESA